MYLWRFWLSSETIGWRFVFIFAPIPKGHVFNRNTALSTEFKLGVDRLSAPILSILPIIDIGHFQNIFADNFF